MIVRNSILLALFSGMSLILAILRDRLLATEVGIGPVLDIYNAAFRVPDLLYGALLAFVTAGTVVPFLTKENKKSQTLDPRQKLFSLTLFFGGLLSIFICILGFFLPYYAHLFVPGFTAEQTDQFIFATRILLVQPFFLGVASLISCFAQLRNEFVLYGVAPLAYSLSIILSILFLYPVFGLDGLLYGVIIGSILSFLLQAISLRNAKLSTMRYYFSYNHIRELVHLALPRTGTNIITQVRTIFFTSLATTLGPGGLSSYLFAQRITDALSQLLQQSVTTASLPVLSKDFIEGKDIEYRATVHRYVLWLGGIGLFASLGVFFFKDIVIWLLYGETGFNVAIEYFLNAFLLILPLTMMSAYLSISLYAKKDTKSVFTTFFIGTTTSVIVGLFYKESGAFAIIAALLTWAIVQFLLLLYFYSRKKTKEIPL